MTSVHLAKQPGQLPAPRQHRPRLWDPALTRIQGTLLDRRLAVGVPPESGRLIGLRARDLVHPARRQRLASDWGRLVTIARERPAAARVPLRRDRIVAAEADIRELQRSLRASAPVPARGVALASSLLADGAGPLYNRNSRVDVRVAVRAAIQYLDPSIALLPTTSAGAD